MSISDVFRNVSAFRHFRACSHLRIVGGRKWGFWIAILASFATIAFDLWGLTIQVTASIGLIVPTISIIILYFKKEQLLAAVE